MAAENDPYNSMLDSEKDDIRPGFLGGNGEGNGKKVLNAAEQAAMMVATKGAGGAGAKGAGAAAGGAKGAGEAKNAMSEGLKSGAAKAEASEKSAGGLYKGNRNNDSETGEKEEPTPKVPKGVKAGLIAAAPLLILLLVLLGIVAIIIALPVMMIGALDYNLMKVLGFEETVGILEEQGEHVTAEFAKNGKMPKNYFNDLVANGIDVGQVTANGDFVRTDVYIANIEDRDDLVASASGFSYISEDEGELAMLWDGKVIYADDFVAAVESNPELYAAYSDAADISTKYYYGEDVEKVYQDMGLSRGNFNSFEVTGDYAADDEKYLEILDDLLNNGSDLAVGGAHRDEEKPDGKMTYTDTNGGTYDREVSEMEPDAVTGEVADNTQEYIYDWRWAEDKSLPLGGWWKPIYSQNSTQRAAGLLNTAISSGEPYLASNAFIAVEEPIQRARVDGGGPVNHIMNTLTKGTEVSYQNVETGEIETSKLSVLETKNFRAAVSDSQYDKEEAQNFGRDRILKTTEQAEEIKGKDVIRRTTVASPGHANSNTAVRNGKTDNEDYWADKEIVSKANENIELSKANNNSETFQSVVGGNRIIEGGSFLSNTINMQVIGAMPSDSSKIAEYHQEVEKTMARRAEAERASKSPFDISSPYTFLGSIVHSIAVSALGNYGSSVASAINSVGATASKAVANLTGSVTASGGDKEFTTMSGIGCETVQMAGGVEGDLYCTSHNTPSTDYISYTFDDFKGSEIGGDIDDEGKPTEGSGLYEFVNYGMDRYASVGVKSAEVCERYREDTGYTPPGQSIFERISNFFKNMTGTYDACDVGTNKDDDTDIDLEVRKIYTGAKYAFGSEGDDKNKLYSSYVMYDEVKSLLTNERSAVSKMREEYRKKHPVDDSAAGVISRRSGMTKGEAEIALAYAGYLNEIAAYDPATRMMGAPVISFEKPILEYHSDEVALTLYAWYSKQTEYDDLRTRNFVV